MDRPKIICLTPVKNEAWILDLFLSAASQWADHIIIADQNSTDGSGEIARQYEKVILIHNTQENYNEADRQKLLINKAREIEGRRLLITLDADEFLTADYKESNEWRQLIDAEDGSYFGFQWINLLPGFKKAWYSKGHFPWAYMDDGSDHSGTVIHSPRLPITDLSQMIELNEIKVLHYQYVDWQRMQSKQKYYQCIERLNFPEKQSVDIYRRYHHMYALAKHDFVRANNKWFEGYENEDIEIRSIDFEANNWFKDEIVKMLYAFGNEKFRQINIWKGWKKYFKPLDNQNKISNPTSIVDRLVFLWLRFSQKKQSHSIVRKIDRIIKYKIWVIKSA